MENLHNLKAEQIVLGALLLNNDFFDNLSFLKPIYFHDPIHQVIFNHIFDLLAVNKKADSITLKGFFNKEIEELFNYSPEELAKLEINGLSKRKGLCYLNVLTSFGAGIVDIRDYAKIIEDLYKKREFIKICQNFNKKTQTEVNKTKSRDLIEKLRLDLDKLEDNTGFEYNIKSAFEIATERFFEIKTAFEEKKPFNENILKTGLFEFDQKFNGLPKGELSLIAGRPSMGKTTLANQIGLNVASMWNEKEKRNNNCIFFSLETAKNQIGNKLLSNKSRINSLKLIHNNVTKGEIQKLKSDCEKLDKINYFINDTYGINPKHIDKCLKRFCRKNGNIDLIVVDYLQIMTADTEKYARNPIKEIGQITNKLKEIAKKYNCVVICLSQLSRGVENRDNKRPNMSDLRESGEIEQIADNIIFCYRDYYYKSRARSKFNPNILTEKESLEKLDYILKEIKNDCELLVRKYRNGICGDTIVNFKPEYCLVNDIDINRNSKMSWVHN